MKIPLKPFFYLFALGITALTIMSSCKNECKDIICFNGGQCNEETAECDCPEAYSGGSCEIVDICILNEVECLNDGVCVSGLCQCEGNYDGVACERCKTEWEGDSCHIEVRNKFLFTFSVGSTCLGGSDYSMDVTERGGSLLNVNISNIDGTGNTHLYSANVRRNDSIWVDKQSVPGGGTAEGSGKLDRSLSPHRLILEMTFTLPDTTYDCKVTGLKN